MDTSQTETGEIVVDAHGDIDMASSVGFHERLTTAVRRAAPGTVVVADLADVTFCDSQGIRALVLAHNLAHGSGRRFRIRSVSPSVEKVLRVAGVFDLLTAPHVEG